MAVERSFSLWLVPSGDAYHALANLIIDLSNEYSSPRFTPHVTLLGGLQGSEEEIRSRSVKLANKMRPYTITLTRLEYQDEYFRSLYIRVNETKQVVQANLQAREVFDRQMDPGYLPHLSILYGNYSSAEKDEIIKKNGQKFTLSFKVKSLHLVDTSLRPESWVTTREFPFRSN
jgi:2'-5' RNA ligase